MSQETRNTDDLMQRAEVPIWLRPILRVCDSVYPFFLIAAAVLTVLLLSLLIVGRPFPWLQNVINLLGLTTALGFLTFLAAGYESYFPGAIGAIIGAVFKFGSPFLFMLLNDKKIVASNNPVMELAGGTLPSLGFFVLALSIAALVSVFVIKFVSEHRVKHTRRYKFIDTSNKDTTKRSLIPRCWQMSRCRPAVRMTCPNYLDRHTCWKRRSGCFCDRELANYLVGSVDRKEAQEVVDMQVAAGSQKSADIRGHLASATKRPWKLQRTLCYSCPLFIEHQEYKYKHLGWTSIPLSVGIIAALYTPYHIGYQFLAAHIDSMVDKMIALGKLPENFNNASRLTEVPFFEYFLLAVLGLLLTSYVISFAEKIFLKWQL
ncbi:MAG: hypothetical protein ACYC7E_01485 [Armatimonadota bacterium]